MPLSDFQRRTLVLLAANRNPDSYIAGATPIHAQEDSPRYSTDIDIFHDTIEAVLASMDADRQTLLANGYRFEVLGQYRSFAEARIFLKGDELRLEWAADSAWRFFPLVPDALFGYRLHPADSATNKVLAGASRREARDYVDLLHLDATFLPLGPLVWAASGKDPGMTPNFILEELVRHAHYREEDFARLLLARPIDLHAAKREWLRAIEVSRQLIDQLPAAEVGCLYLDPRGEPVSPEPSDAERFQRLIRHTPTLGGAWPRVVNDTQ